MSWRADDGCYGWDGEKFVAYFWLVGWDCISLGLHVCVSAPNIEIHMPFGFVRVGRRRRPAGVEVHVSLSDLLGEDYERLESYEADMQNERRYRL